MKKVTSIFFDFGRVLGLFDHMKTCARLTEFSVLSAEEIYELIFKTSGVEKRFDEGKTTFLQFHEEVAVLIGADKNKLTPDTFFDIWGDIFTENPGIAELLARLDPGIRIFILSNTNSTHWAYIKNLPVIKRFFPDGQQRILSFWVGHKKPVMLSEIIKRAAVPEEAIFIDDIEEYVVAARAMGINVIQYDCRTDPVEKLQQELGQFDVLK